ncbi:hypothetical protein HRI_003311800 [Hibiscus trionum]|uniref:Uncharacterized protein n=1 Tax=Hibiscus trionum TaxID=183268 RepID=A0A9W7MFP9_HIBTR|nr:hypothetical protein HRI_003311800 [Hibiscus trionum]
MATPYLLSSPMAPYEPQQDDDHVLVSRDRNFALHGEIMLLIFLLLFALFLAFLLFFLYMKGFRSKASLQDYSSSEQVEPSKFSGVQAKTLHSSV